MEQTVRKILLELKNNFVCLLFLLIFDVILTGKSLSDVDLSSTAQEFESEKRIFTIVHRSKRISRTME